MKILEIKNIVRKDVPIYYRRLYSGDVSIDIVGKTITVPLQFQIEHMPTGAVEITATLESEVDYPIVPLQRELKKFIAEMDEQGKLPD